MIIDAVAGRCGGNTPSDGQHRMRLRAGLRSESTIRPRSSRGWAGNGQLQAVLCARGQPRYVAWLSLAAAPVSAAMAVPAVFTANPSDMLCDPRRITAERNGSDVSTDERVPCGGLYEAYAQGAPPKRQQPLVGALMQAAFDVFVQNAGDQGLVGNALGQGPFLQPAKVF